MNTLDKLRLNGIKLDRLDLEDLIDLTKLNKYILKKEEEEVQEEKKCKAGLIILAIIGILAIGVVIGILVYRYCKPDYLEDFEDEFEEDMDFDDDDDEDFFVDEGEE